MKNQTSSKFYVVETYYVGAGQPYDADRIGIYKTPASGNMDRQPVIEGWAGTTQDWSTVAHGEFSSFADAEAKIAELYPERRNDADTDDSDEVDDDCVALYRPGRYATMTRDGAADWLAEAIGQLTGNETDADLQAILFIAEANANDGGCTLHQSAIDSLTDARDEKRAELQDDAE